MKNLNNLPLRWVCNAPRWPVAYYQSGKVAAIIHCLSSHYDHRIASSGVHGELSVSITDYSMGGLQRQSCGTFRHLADAKLFVNQLVTLYPDLRTFEYATDKFFG